MNDTSFDKELQKIDHYRKFPVMMPFIGKNYKTQNRKLLILCESHYLPEESTIHLDAEKWYNEVTEKDLNEVEKKWINTREITIWEFKNEQPPFINIYNALKDAGMENPEYSIAYMNAFLRPSIEGKSVKHIVEKIDFDVAGNVINKVIDIIQPSYVIFVSKFAWDSLNGNIPFPNKDFTAHPSSHGWWYDTTYPHNKQKFIDMVKKFILQ